MGSKMTSSWSSDIKYSLTIYKRNLSFLGVWPFRKNGILNTMHVVLIFFSQITIAIPQYIDLFFNWKNLDNTIENLTSNVMITVMIGKLITLHLHRDDITACVNSIIEDWRVTGNEEYRKIMKRHSDMGRMVFIGLGVMLYSSYVMYITLAFVITVSTDCSEKNLTETETCKTLPLPAYYIIDTDVSILYEFVFILQSVQGMITCTGNFGVDAFMFYLTMHVCGQLEILKIEFRSLTWTTDSLQPSIDAAKRYKTKIVNLTKRHHQLIKFSKHLQHTFNIMLLGQLFVSCILICVVGFQFILTLENGDILGAGKYMFYMTAIMMQLFLYSFAGDYLQSQSSGLACAAFESPWYDVPSILVRDLFIIMVRAGYPLRISAGQFFVMTLESFKVIVKTSVSYLSVLRVMVN